MWMYRYYFYRLGLVYFSLCLQSKAIVCSKDPEEPKLDDSAQVEVRAVFINCEANDKGDTSDSEATRFEREELFKHSVLRSCNKKLALTVKISNEPDQNLGDEYIPIEHVFEGPSKKRVRLLDPYILRLRREPPLQAYKLRRLDTVSGILTQSDNIKRDEESKEQIKSRQQRDLEKYLESTTPLLSQVQEDQEDPGYYINIRNSQKVTIAFTPNSKSVAEQESKRCDYLNSTFRSRGKRREHNVIVEGDINVNDMPWRTNEQLYQRPKDDGVTTDDFDESLDAKNYKRSEKPIHDKVKRRHNSKKNNLNDISPVKNNKPYVDESNDGPSSDFAKVNDLKSRSTSSLKFLNDNKRKDTKMVDSAEKDFTLYEIGNPELWYTVHVQLFEKMSTPEGRTVWNDITKGESASVSSLSPEWTGQDLNVRYRSTEWVAREEFALPMTSLCLLTPLQGDSGTFVDNSSSVLDSEYIVVPVEDIVGVQEKGNNVKKRDDNLTDTDSPYTSTTEQCHRRVFVRVSRAMFGGSEDKLSIASYGSDRYLTLPHWRRHRAQIDLEARADENQIVRVGASGRLTTIVSDNSHKKRAIIIVQATNTGLAAARFRIVTRDCYPELLSSTNEKGPEYQTNTVLLIPPRQTRRMQLEMPVEIPFDTAHCSVALVNDNDESVAVRDVMIKEGDRCFCVWHCACVCLNEDPKLVCREMPESRQTAAGISTLNRQRHARSCCYPDYIPVNILIVAVGVLTTLFLLGLAKAIVGFICQCVGSWGLDRILRSPRKLDEYYEKSLRSRPVTYDVDGWPIHPDSRRRSIQVVSKPMEFLLNLIFFIVVPCLIICDAIKQIIGKVTCSNEEVDTMFSKKNTKKCFSSQDVQGLEPRWRRRRGGLRKWMTPQAQELSTDIWKTGLNTLTPNRCETMQPLLHEQCFRGASYDAQDSFLDSEQDDTEYVLMQMQKSRESLARSQRNQDDPKMSSVKHQSKEDNTQQRNSGK